jgi:hypothetical protein
MFLSKRFRKKGNVDPRPANLEILKQGDFAF